MQVTLADLRKFAPRGNPKILSGILPALNQLLPHYKIDTPLRVCHFLAQAAHETDGFRTLQEYANGDAYEGRKDLGNTEPGDGRRYKGRGIFQLTGRANYARYGLTATPTKAAEPKTSVFIACEYWNERKLSRYADRNDLPSITKRINGGYNGLADRRAYFRKAWDIWGTGDFTGKTVAQTNTVRAGVVAGSASVATGGLTLADALWTSREVIDTTGALAEHSGFPFVTVFLALVATCAIGYIIYDRWWKSRYEGI